MRRHGRVNTCAGCLPKVTGVQRLLPVLAARQKLPPQTAAEGKLLTDTFFQKKNLGSIRPGDFAPHIPEIYTQNLRMFTSLFLKFFQAPTDKLVGPIFTINTSFDVDPRKVVPFWG